MPITATMTGEEYMGVLLTRQEEWMASQGGSVKVKFPPPLDHFIEDADVALVQLPEKPVKVASSPRSYRSASYWQNRVASLTEEMDRLSTPIIPDRAAAGGQGIGVARGRKVAVREDRKLERYVALKRKLNHAEGMLRKARVRESNPG